MIIVEKEIQSEFAAVSPVDSFQTAEKHFIKDRIWFGQGDTAEEKAAIVNEKVAAFE